MWYKLCLGWLHRLRVLKIFRIKNPNPKKGFIGATVALFCFKPFFRSTAEKVTRLICHIIGRGLLSLFPRLEEWKIAINPSIYWCQLIWSKTESKVYRFCFFLWNILADQNMASFTVQIVVIIHTFFINHVYLQNHGSIIWGDSYPFWEHFLAGIVCELAVSTGSYIAWMVPTDM